MSNIQISQHAETRMAQRGLSQRDIDLLLQIGTEVEGGLLVRRKDVDEYENALREMIERARRLVGKRLVLAEDVVVTAYHSSLRDTKRLLRN